MKEDYGSIYVDMAKPISAHDYFANKTDKLIHNMNPKYLTTLSKEEKDALQSFAHEILYNQQRHCTISMFNLIALVLMHNLTSQKEPLTVQSLITEILWIKGILDRLGAIIAVKDVDIDLQKSLKTHKSLVVIDDESKVILMQNKISLKDSDVSKLKAHALSETTMTLCVPYISLQIYVNHSLHYFINGSLISLIVNFHQNNQLGTMQFN